MAESIAAAGENSNALELAMHGVQQDVAIGSAVN